MFKKNKPKLKTLAAESQQEDKKKTLDLRDADPNYVLAKYEKLRRNGDDIPVSVLMFVGDMHRKLGRIDEAVRLYGEACRKAVEVESWTVAVQLLKKMQKSVNEPTPGMLQLSLQIALGQGLKTEAINVLEKLSRDLAPRQGAEIEAVVGILDRETKVDPDIEMALNDFLIILFRQDRAIERMSRVAARAKNAGQKDIAKRFEGRLLEIGWQPQEQKRPENKANFGGMDADTIRGANFEVDLKLSGELPPKAPAGEGAKAWQDPYTDDRPRTPESPEVKKAAGNEREGSINVTVIPPLAKLGQAAALAGEEVKAPTAFGSERPSVTPGPVIPVFIMPSKPDEKEESKEKGAGGLALPPLSLGGEDKASMQGSETKKPGPLPAMAPFSFPSRPLPVQAPKPEARAETQTDADSLEDFFNTQGTEGAAREQPKDEAVEPLETVESLESIEASETELAPEADNYLDQAASPPASEEPLEESNHILEVGELPESPDLIDIEDESEQAELSRPLPPAPTAAELDEESGDFVNAQDLFGPSGDQEGWGREATRVVADELADLPVSDRDQVRALAGALMSGLRATIDPEDAQSHYDLGTAFLQMKLYQEASEAFQLAFRSPDFRIKAVEGLAQSFMEQNSAGLAYRIVKMVLPELPEGAGQIGAQYWLARAAEALGKTEEARDLYAEISIQDIGFADAAERLRALDG